MLGLADQTRIIDLFEALMKGDMASALAGLKEQHDCGADPGQILAALAEFVHFVTRLKISPAAAKDPSVSEAERLRGGQFAQSLSMAALSRAWQMLLKGLQEVKDSPRPLAAADMVLVRLAYAADLPSPEDILRRLSGAPASSPAVPRSGGSGEGGAPASAMQRGSSAMAAVAPANSAPVARTTAQPADAPRVRLQSFEALVAFVGAQRDIQLKVALERDVSLVRFEEGRIEFSLKSGASPQLAHYLTRRLQEWTAQRWMVAISSAPGAPTLHELAQARDEEQRIGVQSDPLVRAALEQFPGAAIVAVRVGEVEPSAEPARAPTAGGEDVAYVDETDDEDL